MKDTEQCDDEGCFTEVEPSDLTDDSISDYVSTPEHKTNILPLRWLVNFSNLYISSFALNRALYQEDKAYYHKTKLSKRGYMWWKLYRILDWPYSKWGTTYVVDWHRNADK